MIVGSGNFQYRVNADWAKLPEGWSFKEVGGVGVDSHDHVYVFNRGEHPMMIFDREGNFLRSWGEGQYPRAHGVHMAPDDTIFLTDDGGHFVRNVSLDGNVLLELGAPSTSLSFTRPYASGAGTSLGQATSSAALGYVYSRAGAVFTPTPQDELAPALELGNEWLSTANYAEALTPGNPFNAAAGNATDQTLVGKARAHRTHTFSPQIDATVWAAGARALTNTTSLALTVGTFSPLSVRQPSWAEYGARLSYNVNEKVAVEAFMNGASGGGGVSTAIHGGIDLRVTL